MESEKSVAPDAIFVFDSRSAADRRIAGVAAAARAARGWLDGGGGKLWLALPGGGPLASSTVSDLQRLVGRDCVTICEFESLATLLAARPADADGSASQVPILPAPVPTRGQILRATAKTTDGAVASSLNRPISRLISATLLELPGFRPVHATIGTAILAGAMFLALVLGGQPGLVAGGLLFQAASIFDGVDGEIARATFRTSAAGARLDSVVDAFTNLLFILGVTVNLHASGAPHAATLGIWGLALFGTGLVAIGWRTARSDEPYSFNLVKQEVGTGGRWAPFVAGFAITVTSRDFFAFLYAVLILAGRPMAVLVIFAMAATIWLAVVLVSLLAKRHPPQALAGAEAPATE